MEPKRRPPSIWSATLYYAQGLPFSVVRQVTVVYFKERGVALKDLGKIALFGIPWTFKFLWSPLVDTYSTKRRWVLVMELALACVAAVVAHFVHQVAAPITIAAVFLIMSIVSATHDIATDGFYLEALDKNDQAKYSGWIVAAYRLAMLTGSGLLVAVSGKLGWTGTFLAVAGMFLALSSWHLFFLPHPQKRVSTEQGFEKMIEGFKSFLKLPGVGLAVVFVVLFKLGDALLYGMSTPFLLDAGMSKAQLGIISGIFGVGANVLASIAGGWFISRFGLKKGLWIFGIVQNVAIPFYAFVAWNKSGIALLSGAVVVEQIAASLGTAAYSNFLMRQNHPNFKATHYAIVSGMMSLTTMMGGVISGFGAQKYGYAVFFTLAFVASLPGLALVPFVARRPECQPMGR